MGKQKISATVDPCFTALHRSLLPLGRLYLVTRSLLPLGLFYLDTRSLSDSYGLILGFFTYKNPFCITIRAPQLMPGGNTLLILGLFYLDTRSLSLFVIVCNTLSPGSIASAARRDRRKIHVYMYIYIYILYMCV
jgi:hypothetical protein